MLTIKLPYETSNSNKDYIFWIQRQQNCAIKYLFNRVQEETRPTVSSQFTEYFHSLNNVESLDSWFMDSAARKAKENQKSYLTVLKKVKEYNYKNPGKKKSIPKVIFGGKDNFEKRSKKKMKKIEWNIKKLSPIISVV